MPPPARQSEAGWVYSRTLAHATVSSSEPGANALCQSVQLDWLSRIKLDQFARKPQRRVRARLESGRKFLDLLGVMVPVVARPVRVALNNDRERRFAVNLHQPMVWQRREVRVLVRGRNWPPRSARHLKRAWSGPARRSAHTPRCRGEPRRRYPSPPGSHKGSPDFRSSRSTADQADQQDPQRQSFARGRHSRDHEKKRHSHTTSSRHSSGVIPEHWRNPRLCRLIGSA